MIVYSQAEVDLLKLCVCVSVCARVFVIYFNNLKGNNVSKIKAVT